MIDEINEKKLIEEEQIRAYAEIYAKNLILYGVDVREKLETATQMSYALDKAYMRGRQDGTGINVGKNGFHAVRDCQQNMTIF